MKRLLALTCAITFASMAYSAGNSDTFWIDVKPFLRGSAPRPEDFKVEVYPNETWESLAYKIQYQVPDFNLGHLLFGGRNYYAEKYRNTTINQTSLHIMKEVFPVFVQPSGEFVKGYDE